jgi:hypothetical protein
MIKSKKERKAGREKWSRADKINFFVAAFAVITTMVPPGVHALNYLQRPRAAITSPFPGEHVPNNTFGVTGTATSIPANDDLWLVVRAGIQGRWYPIRRVLVTDGKWAVGPNKLCPQPGPHDIEIFLVPNNGGGQFFAYVGSKAQSEGLGIDSIPPTAVLEAVSQVIVPAHARLICKQGKGLITRR